MSLNYTELVRQMAFTPQVREAVEAKAEKLKRYLEMRWPEVNDLTQQERAYLRERPEHSILINEDTTNTDRPAVVVTVRHPGAVAKQAKDGFVTKAVKDVS